jgi:hypothetical protein
VREWYREGEVVVRDWVVLWLAAVAFFPNSQQRSMREKSLKARPPTSPRPNSAGPICEIVRQHP